MLQIGDNTYRLIGLDTNALSAISLNRGSTRRGFFSKLDGCVACFSPYSLFELRRHPRAFRAFIEFFDIVPCLLLKNEGQLFEDERAAYPHHSGIDPTIMTFSVLNRDKGTNLESILEAALSTREFRKREAVWPKLKEEILASWIALKPNFKPKGDTFTLGEGLRFVDEATRQHVAIRAPDWVRSLLHRGEIVESAAFPSVRMTEWSIFFRLYWPRGRSGEVQDVFDALISTPAPYLDAVVTEKFQAEIYREVRKIDRQLLNLSVYTLGDLEAGGRHA